MTRSRRPVRRAAGGAHRGPSGTAPAITSSLPSLAGLYVGDAFPAYSPTATGDPAPTFTTSTLPSGVTFDGTTFGGVMPAAGAHSITITATNGVSPDDTQVWNFSTTTWSPLILAPRLWLDASDFSGGTTWADSSGNGYTFTGTATASTDGGNSAPAVSFNGTSHRLDGPSWNTILNSSTDYDIFVAYNTNTLTHTVEPSPAGNATAPVLFGYSNQGVSLLRGIQTDAQDGNVSGRKAYAATLQQSSLGGGAHRWAMTRINEGASILTRHGKLSGAQWASGPDQVTQGTTRQTTTFNGSTVCSIGQISGGNYFAGKITHILVFDFKLTDAQATQLQDWINTDVGLASVPRLMDPTWPASRALIDLQQTNALQIGTGGVAGVVLGVEMNQSWFDYDATLPDRTPPWAECYWTAQRADKATISGKTALSFIGNTKDYCSPKKSTGGGFPSSYTTFSSMLGYQEHYGSIVIKPGAGIYQILREYNSPFRGLNVITSGGDQITWFGASVAFTASTLLHLEFGVKVVAGNAVSRLRINNGATSTFTNAGLVTLTGGDIWTIGDQSMPNGQQFDLFRLQAGGEAASNTNQQKVRDAVAAEYGLTLATTDLFA